MIQGDKNTFGKEERLKSRKTIDLIFKSGKSTREGWMAARYIIDEEGDIPLRVGFTVPKRRIRRAVDRNLIKRRMREAYRLHKHALWAKLLAKEKSVGLMFVFSGQKVPGYNELEDKIILILNRLSDDVED